MTDTSLERRQPSAPVLFSDAELKRRIDMNRAARFGLENATREQLNVVFVLARRWGLDPVTDLTLFEGHPWITIEGHGRLLRRNPGFRGIKSRPLTKDEREQWGYEADDIVIETVIKTSEWGEVSARGKVSRADVDAARSRAEREKKKSAPIGVHPVEIAEKRSIARAARLAFGADMPDEEDIDQEMRAEIAERSDPAKVKANAEMHKRIFDNAYPDEALPPPEPEADAEEDAEEDD
jgi:hypothetical protein